MIKLAPRSALLWGAAAAALALLGVPFQACAQETDLQATVGAGALVFPKYEGAEDFRALPIPYLDITWKDRVFVNNTDGLGAYAVNDQVVVGLGMTVGIGRRDKDIPQLKGVGRVADAPRPRAFGRVLFGPAFVGASVSRDIGGSDGLLADASVGVSLPLHEMIAISAAATATFADGKHMRAFFGITPGQSLGSGIRAYAPEAGLKRADISVSANVALSPRWLLLLNGGSGRLMGDAADSPIVEQKWQPFATAALAYRF